MINIVTGETNVIFYDSYGFVSCCVIFSRERKGYRKRALIFSSTQQIRQSIET